MTLAPNFAQNLAQIEQTFEQKPGQFLVTFSGNYHFRGFFDQFFGECFEQVSFRKKWAYFLRYPSVGVLFLVPNFEEIFREKKSGSDKFIIVIT